MLLKNQHSYGCLLAVGAERGWWSAEQWTLCPRVTMCCRQQRERTENRPRSRTRARWRAQSLVFTLNTRAHVRTPVSLLLPQNFPALVFSARSRAVFLHACWNSCLHSPFPPKQGKGKQKHNKRIRGDYRLSEFWNSKCVCLESICFNSGLSFLVCMYKRDCLHVATQRVVCVHMWCMCDTWEPKRKKNLYLSSTSSLRFEYSQSRKFFSSL